jgi:hypothetical protein
MKQTKYLSVLALLLIGGMVGCTPAPTAPPPMPTELPADTAVPTPAEEASSWEVIIQADIEQPVRMAAFLDNQVGFTGGPGADGTAQYTTDGGKTWTVAEEGGG